MQRVVIFLCIGLLAVGPLAAPASAKSYFFTRVAIDAHANPDGSMWITERRTYKFNGSFSWATYALERRGWSDVTDISLADESGRYTAASTGTPRTYQVALSPKELAVKWHFSAEDEERTFTIRYRVAGVVTRYRDTGELFWQFIGTGWEVPTESVRISVLIPGAAKADLRAWGHGPLDGVVALHDGKATLEVADLDKETAVEARILFPAALVPGAPLKDEAALPRILAEEARLARAANLERLTPLLNVLMFPIAFGLALATWLILYLRHGKEHRIHLPHPYLREPPASYGPAILGALLRWGTPSGQDFGATILDLARQGHLTIRQEGDGGSTHRFVRTGKSVAGISASDGRALVLLFRWGGGSGITDREFRSAAWRHADAGRMFKDWQRAVETEAKSYGFFDEGSRRTQERVARLHALMAVGGVLLTIFIIITFRLWLITGFVAFPLGGMFLSLLKGPLVRRTMDGATDLAQWRAFRRFLRDFSTLRDAPPPAIAVWESYLPYAVSLGVAARVIRQFPAAYGDQAATAAISWYTSTSGLRGTGRGGALVNLSSVSRGLARSVAIAATPRSSASGSGGGFSRSSSSSSGGGSRGGGGSGGRAG